MVESELPSCPWEVIGSDIFVFESKLYVVIIDYYSRRIEALLVHVQTSGAIIYVMKSVFSRFGVTKIVRSDNGRCYDSDEFRNFAASHGFQLVTSSPRYPQSNGLAEGAVKIVKKLWLKNEDKIEVLSVYRTTPLSTGYSPSELMFGRAVRSTFGLPRFCQVDYEEFEKKNENRKTEIKQNFDKKYRVSEMPELNVNDKVSIKSPSDAGTGGIVVRKDPLPDSYWGRIGDKELRRNRKHLFLRHENEFDKFFENDLGSCLVDTKCSIVPSPLLNDNGEKAPATALNAASAAEPDETPVTTTRSGRLVQPHRYSDMVYS
ncbi:uncharacterized protein [Watersipora subatra]|uniref:uncharacterized protein n=1 Tax=Watersipora subatra TaxID=2589382 RepID=UPI00355B279A